MTQEYPVEGMSCASCAAHVTKALQHTSGVNEVIVNLATARARIDYDEALTTPESLREAVKHIGFDLLTDQPLLTDAESNSTAATAAIEESEKEAETRYATRYKQLRRRAVGATLTAIPLLVLSLWKELFAGQNVLLFFLASFSLWRYGREFYSGAWRLLRHGTANMDTLVSLSTAVAYTFSCANLFYPDFFRSHGITPHLYFDSAGVITAFILLGRMLEMRARRRTSATIRGLMKLQPRTVMRIAANGIPTEVALSDIRPGDILLARQGERIAADGKVSEGLSSVDESTISGEPLPVVKQTGDNVLTGTIVTDGLLHYEVQKVGADTLLSHIVRMVQEAQGTKVPIQALVDRIAAIFVPTILCISLLSLALWLIFAPTEALSHGLLSMVSVLVVACPCSLGLATPTAIIVGMGRGASKGILIKDATALQLASHINAIVLDKTGTLTTGRPRLKHRWLDASNANDEARKKQVTTAIVTLEKRSRHPLSAAITEAFPHTSTLPVTNFEETAGSGICGNVDGHQYAIGTPQFVGCNPKDFTEPIRQRITAWESEANTLIYVTSDGILADILAVADELKPGAAATISSMKQEGVEVHMLTGDAPEAAKALAKQADIQHYKARVLPNAKADYVKMLRSQGKTVAMVGDGINDSAALAHADLSIAMGHGSDIAMETAMVTLLSSDLGKIVETIQLSSAVNRTIRQNLFWAFIYNIVSVPIAAGVLFPVCGFMLSPMIAGAAMALSSVSVVTNSILLSKKI